MIKLSGVNKIHNQHGPNPFQSLTDINLEVGAGELVILKGISGSGKSTLLSIIAALNKPTSGELEVNGQKVAKLPDLHSSRFRSETIGFVFQEFNLLDELDVQSNVSVPLIPAGLKQEEVTVKTLAALKLVNIEHKASQMVRDLSGGEKQRTAIARALVNDASVILCDEPTANLDKENSLKFISVLEDLKKMGKTIVTATHDALFETLPFVDRVVLIENGKILEK